MDADLDLALELADAADVVTLGGFRAPDLEVHRKPDGTPVSAADRSAETVLRRVLAERRPDDLVVGEELGGPVEPAGPTGGGARRGAPRRGARRWVLDPIDGTRNYVRGVIVFATLIALEEDGGFRVGVVSAPALGYRWWAVRGHGAYGTGGPGGGVPRRLEASAVQLLGEAAVSIGGLGELAAAGLGEPVLDLSRRCAATRGQGDFWAHVLVAEGGLDAAVEPSLRLWDYAALDVILGESGGRLSGLDGGPPTDGAGVVSSNGKVHAELLEILAG